MKPLNAEKLLQFLNKLKDSGQDLKKVPIYIGDDEELNGAHTAFDCETYNVTDEEFIELLEECGHEIKFKDKAILIS